MEAGGARSEGAAPRWGAVGFGDLLEDKGSLVRADVIILLRAPEKHFALVIHFLLDFFTRFVG